MGYKVAVVGATGNVGHEMLSILAERNFPADEVVALASRLSLRTSRTDIPTSEKLEMVEGASTFERLVAEIVIISYALWLRRDAMATTSSAGKLRSARMLSSSCPTLPVAPTTATL